MRTTLDIDDEILRAAKDIARRTRRTAGQVISELARRALTGVPDTSENAIAEAQGFYGFNPLPADDRVVSEEKIESLREEEGI